VQSRYQALDEAGDSPRHAVENTGGGTYSADTAIAVPLLKVVRLIM